MDPSSEVQGVCTEGGEGKGREGRKGRREGEGRGKIIEWRGGEGREGGGGEG